MAKTNNLSNINFMSRERFDSLTEIDDNQLYAVEFPFNDEDLVHTHGNEEIGGEKTFNSTLQLKNNLSFRSYGSNDSGRLQFRAQPSDNVIRGTFAITDAYKGYDGWVSQMVARSGDLSTDGFNTLRVSEKGVEYIKEEPNGNVISNHKLLDTSALTNCITEIPQDIKLEVYDATRLVLKAGSKYYISKNGTFDVVNVSSDIIGAGGLHTPDGSRKLFVVYSDYEKILTTIPVEQTFSSATTPITLLINQYGGWFDTSTNTMKYTMDGGVNWYYCSLPLAMGRPFYDSSVVSWEGRIDQIFNGFGYVGSTMFVLPGVKGLIPNGRNADGSLNNVEFVLDVVSTMTYPAAGNNLSFSINSDGNMGTASAFIVSKTKPSGEYILWYNPIENLNRYKSTGNFPATGNKTLPLGVFSSTATQITSFQTKTPFHALDYNDKSTIVGWCMPDYSAGVSKSKDIIYQAECDGFIRVYGVQNDINAASLVLKIGFKSDLSDYTDIGKFYSSPSTHLESTCFIPIPKGMYYKAADSKGGFTMIFYPAKGEVNA